MNKKVIFISTLLSIFNFSLYPSAQHDKMVAETAKTIANAYPTPQNQRMVEQAESRAQISNRQAEDLAFFLQKNK